MKRFAIFLMLLCSPAAADAPRVVTDIAPIHSLVAMVMKGVGEPALLLDNSSDPHGGALRPSQARALAGADVVVWMGAGLTPWLAEAINRSSAESLALLDWPATTTLPLREKFEEHDDHDHHDHGDETIDPHAWLDPVNARLWLGEIAAILGAVDPHNAAEYGANARAGMTTLSAMTTEMENTLLSAKDAPFAVEHDAFHYLEDRFELRSVAAHSAGDGDKPGPLRLRTLLKRLDEGDVKCLFAEAGSSSRILKKVPDTITIVVLDPLGTKLATGTDLYTTLMLDMAAKMASCLTQ